MADGNLRALYIRPAVIAVLVILFVGLAALPLSDWVLLRWQDSVKSSSHQQALSMEALRNATAQGMKESMQLFMGMSMDIADNVTARLAPMLAQQQNRSTSLVAELLMSMSTKLAGSIAAQVWALLQQPPPAKPPEPRIHKGLVRSTELQFHGHNLTMVGLTNDEYVSTAMFNLGAPWGARLLGALMDFIKPGDTVVDAGANIGTYSIFFGAQAGPTGRVFSFEPQARMFQMLCTNIVVNALFQVQPKNMALSYKAATMHMQANLTDGSLAGLDKQSVERQGGQINYGGMRLGLGGEEVQARTLDSFKLDRVAVMKVDVQWADKLMFYGARDTIKRTLPVIAFEIAGSEVFEKDLVKDLGVPAEVANFNVTDFLLGLGYRKHPNFMFDPEDIVMLPPGHPLLL